jgi:hypothetical protein
MVSAGSAHARLSDMVNPLKLILFTKPKLVSSRQAVPPTELQPCKANYTFLAISDITFPLLSEDFVFFFFNKISGTMGPQMFDRTNDRYPEVVIVIISQAITKCVRKPLQPLC